LIGLSLSLSLSLSLRPGPGPGISGRGSASDRPVEELDDAPGDRLDLAVGPNGGVDHDGIVEANVRTPFRARDAAFERLLLGLHIEDETRRCIGGRLRGRRDRLAGAE
jgi:hypothetical protein